MAGAHHLNAAQMASGRLYECLAALWGLAFLLLGFSFVMVGLSSLNLLHLVSVNVNFVVMYGLDVVCHGGLSQFVSLIGLGYFAALFYVLFSLCEKVLVERLTYGRTKGH